MTYRFYVWLPFPIVMYSMIDVVNTPSSCFKNLIQLAIIAMLPCAVVIANPRTNKELF